MSESSASPSAAALAGLPPPQLAQALEEGAVVLMPTDTLPAVAARPAHAQRIWALKRRPAEKPLILMGADLDQLQPLLGIPWRDEWLALAGQGWPGALTLVLPARGPCMEALHPGGTTLGLRVPACAQVQALLRCSGPLATTSANPSGAPAAVDAASAAAYFPGLPLLAPVPWPQGTGQASTVLAWQGPASAAEGPGHWRVLRAGAVPPPSVAA